MKLIKTKSITREEFAVKFKEATEEYFYKLQDMACITSAEYLEECYMIRDVINSLLEHHNDWASRYEHEKIGAVR